VALGSYDGRPVVLSGGQEGIVQVWQFADGGEHQVIDLGSTVEAVAYAGPCQVVVGTAMGIVVLRLGRGGARGSGR
jgi:hypothetical protein